MSFFKKLFGKKTEEEKKEQLDKSLEKTKSGFFDKIKKAVAGKSTVDVEVLDEVVLKAKVEATRMEKIKNSSQGQVEFFDDEKCQTSMGKGRVRLQNAEQSCKSIIDRISSFGNVDSVSFDGSCLNINNDSSYTKDQLVEQCVNNI